MELNFQTIKIVWYLIKYWSILEKQIKQRDTIVIMIINPSFIQPYNASMSCLDNIDHIACKLCSKTISISFKLLFFVMLAMTIVQYPWSKSWTNPQLRHHTISQRKVAFAIIDICLACTLSYMIEFYLFTWIDMTTALVNDHKDFLQIQQSCGEFEQPLFESYPCPLQGNHNNRGEFTNIEFACLLKVLHMKAVPTANCQ